METQERSYQEVRSFIQTGDLIGWQGTSLWAKGIRWWTEEPWSHVGIAYWVGPRLFVVDAYPMKGVRLRPLSNDLDGCHWIHAKQPAPFTPEIEAWMLDHAEKGTKYSIPDCVRVAMNRLPKSGNGFQCAEFAAIRFAMAGLEVPDSPTPGNLIRWLGERAIALKA